MNPIDTSDVAAAQRFIVKLQADGTTFLIVAVLFWEKFVIKIK